jgi:hypothetical protein
MPAGLTYTLANLHTDIRGYTEVGDTVFSDSVLSKFIINRRRRNEYQDGVIRLPIKSESPSTY